MPEINLTQTEADFLIQIEKHRLDDTVWDFPDLADSLQIPLISFDKKESFFLDIWRSQITLKGRYQTRARKIIVLVRLDFGGSSHRNPDDTEILSPHIHLYKEGYGDKWAYPIQEEHFSSITNLWVTLEEFMRFCHITFPPNIKRGLWI